MMHIEKMVVSIRDAATKKTFREYDHSRCGWESEARIALQDGTEYEFVLKNQSDKRRLVLISIDGTEVCGDGIIIGANQEVVLERFLESDKRFKAVLTSNPAVQDPTASDNGKVIVKVWEEIDPPIFTAYKSLVSPFHNWPHRPYGPWTGDYEAPIWTLYSSTASLCGSVQPTEVVQAFNATYQQEPLATVEGSKSDQSFTKTTWLGNATFTPVTFSYRLTLASAETKTGFCTDCGVKLVEAAKFCQDCGCKVKR